MAGFGPWCVRAGLAGLIAAAVVMPGALTASAAERSGRQGSGERGSGERAMDFSHVTTHAQAEALVRRGELIRIRPFPERFGGPATPENSAYVPAGTEVALDFAHDRISGLIDLKSVDRMVVKPRYRGKSVVPAAITYICSGKGKGSITMTIDIW
jgi:hypothetical protein